MKKRLFIYLVAIFLFTTGLLADKKNQAEDRVSQFIENFSLSWKARTHEISSQNNFYFKLDDRQSVTCFITDPHSYQQLARPVRHKTRAFLEFFSLFSYSGINYNLKYSKFIEDWQWRFTWHDQKERFFTFNANRFDSNDFGLNWRHALAGMIYYEFARSNNLTWWQSSLYSIGGSLAWEYMVEWREVISINDNFMTGLGGYVLGETWFQLGRYFFNSPSRFTRLFSWLNPFMKINGWLDRKQPLPPYFQSYNRQAQDVYLFVGYRHSPTSTSSGNVGNLDVSLNSRIITAQEYGLPGKINEKFTSPIYSQLDVELMYHGQTREELDIMAKIVPLGYFQQNISAERRGYSIYYGLGSAFQVYIKRPVVPYDGGGVPINRPEDFHFENPRDFRDKLSAVHIAGPVFSGTYFYGPWSFRLKSEAYLSFGMINALALNKYSIDNPVQGMKTTLTFYGYYYALGPYFESSVQLAYKQLQLEAFTSYVYYRSLQGRDRFQNELLDDSVVKDSRQHYGLRIQYRFPHTYFSLLAAAEQVKRWGKIHQTEDRTSESRYYLGLKFNL